ncbi:hypothetical protein H6A65_00995 [Mediterraneibacter glycyrrhizinilyticus]|uniref:Uncharacterized protein n=1 Tax=Candidatus Mediterraneibacter stercoravium TaxID=2838685 RepID=A0A9D2K1U2_9FIRM|nr:hypothetical protein [Mediterraneibacter glycyrrhizinilyticus]MBM6750080.1 hypothetical protein [Mediterraneibacter glycyrrhizinilyticus]HIZ75965.1 hypothetical protein [Candidatus Mediterraneibacter stercoravium]
MKTVPFGYKMIDGIFEVDKLGSEIVSWIYERHIRYSEHPPAVLVEGMIEEYKISKERKISYEEAEKLVPSDSIYDYIDREVRLRIEAYKLYSKDESIEDLKYYLECPLAELDVDEIIEAYKKEMKKLFEQSRNPVIIGLTSGRRDRC